MNSNHFLGKYGMGRVSKREQLLDTAEKLFVRDGYSATGINRITDEADVATMTLYNNFDDKDDLIVAMLERRAHRFNEQLEVFIAHKSTDPYLQILAVFDDLDSWIRAESKSESGFAGCAFMKASLEFNSSDDRIHKAALAHRHTMLKLFERLLKQAGYTGTKEKSYELLLLHDGAITQAQMLGNKKSARRARSMAELMLAYD